MPTTEDTLLDELRSHVTRLSSELNRRAAEHGRLLPYDEGGSPAPQAVVDARLQNSYRSLMPSSEAPWGSLVIDSVLDRLEVSGIRDTDKRTAEAVWGVWQDNGMDAESKLGHRSALLDGRAFALVWPGENGPEIHLDDSTQMVVEYRSGSRRHRVAALRRWREGKKWFATLYRPDGIYKFESETESAPEADGWQMRFDDADWPLENPYGVVPVVEIAVNRRLKPGEFGYARGEFAHCTGLIDRINLLTFLGMVVAVWMGFPLRGVTGERATLLRDDEGKPLLTPAGAPMAQAPFDSRPDTVVQFENPEAKVFQLPAADRKLLSVYQELDQLAVITKTPRHYFPLEQGMSQIAADTIRANEGALHAKCTGHKATLGEGWEEVQRLAGMMLDEPVELSPRAEIQWADHESRSLAEMADAAVKLSSIEGLPWQYVLEKTMNATNDEIARIEADGALGTLLRAATEPPPAAEPPVPDAVAR